MRFPSGEVARAEAWPWQAWETGMTWQFFLGVQNGVQRIQIPKNDRNRFSLARNIQIIIFAARGRF